MNYGHPLEFGTFVTPAAGEGAVRLARRGEELGYDLVTFQDHPYQPAFLDTWTLMSWVAGQTERIHIAANVLNLPLRQPAVLARSAASLDLLSGGRLDLALGAGPELAALAPLAGAPDGRIGPSSAAPEAFWDAIEAMGGRRLSPGQAVDALAEAIDVIRGVLDAGEPGKLRYAGEHYRLAGAERGPLPRHHIPIWLGARQRRMLRLVGRAADGWLPSLGYLKPGEFRAGNKIIDEAAAEAGRDPAEIRRLVNIAGRFARRREGFLQGPPPTWVDDLLPLVVEDGVGTFILMSDDPGTLERFAREVAPALRERDTTTFLVMGLPRGGQPAVAQLYGVVDSADPDTVVAQLQPFAGIAPMFEQQVVIAPYAAVMGMAPDAEHHGRGEPVSRSAFVREITPAFADAAARLLRGGVVYFFQLRTVGGAVADVDPDATAYAHRDAGFSVIAMGVDRRRLDAAWDALSEHFDGLYLSFETDQRPERLTDAFPPRTLRRLRELKARYDPGDVFRDNFNIHPEAS
jgi:alkanesulfonate monooxygenase SsuD/methylene tetrahydromethanopterin reductase-like flavin-dependent oxidoreductase (luciferase family)